MVSGARACGLYNMKVPHTQPAQLIDFNKRHSIIVYGTHSQPQQATSAFFALCGVPLALGWRRNRS